MVYESDFYTSRRPYSRPSYSTYSVTYEPAHLYPGYGKGQTYHHFIPHAGHMRLTAVSPPSYNVRTRPSVILAEIDRINNRVRPNIAYQPAEDFLNSRSIVCFDDEARAIRGQAAHILKRIHTPVPRALRPLPVITTGYEYEELPLPPRITSDMYIHRMLGLRDVQKEVLSRSYYNEPGSRANIGKGHLACISYAGGKPFSRRRPLASHENNGDYIRNNVKMLSHYERMREAANSPVAEEKVLSGEARQTFIRGSRPVNSGFYRPTNDPGKEYAEALASAAVATANFNMHTAALEENRRNKQKKEDARLAAAAEEREPGDDEQESQKKAEDETKRKAQEEAKKKAEDEAKLKVEQEAKRKAEEEAKKKAEEEAAKKKAEEEAKKKAEEEAQKKAEEEAKKKAEEEAKKKAQEEAKRKAEEEAKRKAEEEEARKKAEEEEARRKAEEEEAKKKAEEEEARKKAEEEEAKRKEEEETRRKQEEEEARKKAEEEAQSSEPAKEDATVDDIWPAGDDDDMPRKKATEEATVDDIWPAEEDDMPRKKVTESAPWDSKETDTQLTEDQSDSKPAEEEQAEQGPEPVVEEPTSPETPAPNDQPEIEEMPASEEE